MGTLQWHGSYVKPAVMLTPVTVRVRAHCSPPRPVASATLSSASWSTGLTWTPLIRYTHTEALDKQK